RSPGRRRGSGAAAVKFTLNILDKPNIDQEQRWPRYVFGGRARTSTVVLIVVLVLVAWVYNVYRPQPASHNGPGSTQVVPPGFVPDPTYRGVPRDRVTQPQQPTPPNPPTTTETTTPSQITPPPTAPCLVPALCPSTSSPPSGLAPVPTSVAPAG